jgi:hypothetical protein
MPIKLDAGTSPPRGVDNPSHLTVFVGDPPRQLLIFTGVAIPEFASDEDLERDEVQVRLGAITSEQFQWTAQAALASVVADEGDFIFAVDGAFVDTDTDDVKDGVLRLRAPVAVQADSGKLLRISYTVHVLSDPIQNKINGIISWDQSFGAPTGGVTAGGKPMFRVDLGHTVTIPAAPGNFATTKFVTQTSGFSGRPVAAGHRWICPYEIDDVPLGQPWEVRPVLLAQTLAGPPAAFDAAPGFQPFPQHVQLSLAQPSASGVDFVMSFTQGGPR